MLRPFLHPPTLYYILYIHTWELLHHNDYLLLAKEELHRGKEGFAALLTYTLSYFFVSKSFHHLK